MNTPFLEIDGLVGGYAGVDALKGVSLSVRKGSITCLLGPNGAGKTALMMTIAGLLRPRRGAIRFEGRDLAGRPPHAVVAQGIALVPQDRLLFGNLSVRDNIEAGAYLRKDRDGIEADRKHLHARFPRLRERQDQKAGTLSGGEQQMLAMARALMSRPKLLLLDEPTLGLAPLVVRDIFRLIGEINADGTSILLVEQNAPMALDAAHHVYLLDRGKVTFGGDPDRLAGERAAREQVVDRAWLGQSGSSRSGGGPMPGGCHGS
ncbi:MAG TPA: ABC transporter ATP-binding protein [Arenibaculum sp.]|nr:ABC transporter ATP-binding protein [Arenibaculum sp.]